MERAYSLLQVKRAATSEGVYRLSGIASTPTTDRTGDIVEPMGATFTLPMPLLWQHDHQKPVGKVIRASATPRGIEFEAIIPKVADEGTLKTRVDEAIHSLEHGLVAAVSVGFRALDQERMPDGGIRFSSWEWMELSLVTIPANTDATVALAKQLSAMRRSAVKLYSSGNRRPVPRSTRKPIYLISNRIQREY